ncbi:MAG: hypothetical protein AAF683_09005 [Pseudomonadota bacterium]
MVDGKTQFNIRGSRPWAQIGFDVEGIVGALAAWLVGMLLGAVWGPLFWLGVIGAGVILLATRKQTRTAPDAANLVTAPCDGVIQSIGVAVPPSELRLPSSEYLRVRVSSSPASPNTVHAPITGEIKSVIQEEPNPSVIFASEPDVPGLAVAHLSVSSMGEAVGITVSTGGFGPRLEVLCEAGDAVRAGRVVAKRRLGGWCDIFLKAESRLLVREGQTLIGSETVLCRLSVEPSDLAQESDDTAKVSSAEIPEAEIVDTKESDLAIEETTETMENKSSDEASDGSGSSTDSDEDLSDEEISEMFEKLKQKADEASQ